MQRRQFTKATAVGLCIGGLAGCTEDGTQTVGGGDEGGDDPTATGNGGDGDDPTDTPTDAETKTETETDTETEASGSASISIASDELEKTESSYSTDAYVFADVVNEGDAPSGEIALTARFYDGDGNLIGDGSSRLVRLLPGETWKAAIWFIGDGEEVEDYEVEGEYVEEAPNFEPDGIELTGSEMEKSSDEAVISGTLKNNTGDEVSYVEVHGLFYADETTILASDWTNQTDIPDGDTWKFEVTIRNRIGRVEEVNSHKVVYKMSSY